jgi:hypothetical protein
MLPDFMDGVIVFQLWRSKTVLDAYFSESFVVFIENNCVYALVLIIGMDANQIENNVLAILLGI